MYEIVMADHGIEFDGTTPSKKPLGGAESGFVKLAETFAKRGHKVTAFSKCKEAVEHNGVKWHPVDKDKKLLSSMEPDLYIAHRGDKVLNLVPKAKNTAFLIQNPAKYLLKWRYFWKLTKINPTLVFIGDYHKTTYPTFMPPWGGENKKQVIKFAISDPFMSVKPLDNPPPPRAIFTSNPLRGLDWLLDIWEYKIHSKAKEAELHVFSGAATYGAAGDEKAQEMGKVLQRAENLKDKGVVLRKPVGKDELCEELRQSRVMLYKGDINETFCFSLGEAQAAGLPCVVQPIGSVVERIVDGKTGAIEQDEDKYADAAIEILTNDVKWREMVDNCLKLQRQWTWGNTAEAYEKLII
ncbi:MAG: glycosyltransferase family 4 protein [Alphaproteobacteria bacterium]|nr:glycosyltransferase family 4 protein [Alphaproteobacteria bacterium]